MYRYCGTSPNAPTNVRRRHQALHDLPKIGVDYCAHETHLDGLNELELSIHLPDKPFGNRFDVLTVHPTPSGPAKDDRVNSYHRRHHHNRAKRDPKIRRDARRSWKKRNTAQILDERLSREIDRTIRLSNVTPPALSRLPASASPEPTMTDIAMLQPIYVSSSPPQLPPLDFGRPALMDETQYSTTTNTTLKPTAPPPQPLSLPDWCPSLPAWINDSNDKYQILFDLRCLSAPNLPTPANSKVACRELQLWRPERSPQAAKQSMFFLCAEASKSTNPLHSPSPKDGGVSPRDNDSQKPCAKPRPVVQNVKIPLAIHDDRAEATAANLWHILLTTDTQPCGSCSDPYATCTVHQTYPRANVAPVYSTDYTMKDIDMTAELPAVELPYRPTNSLTGHANARPVSPTQHHDETAAVLPALTPCHGSHPGMNELVVDHSYADEDNRYASAVLAAIQDVPPFPLSPPIDYPSPSIDGLSSTSESSIVALPSPALESATAIDDLVDVAATLDHGRVRSCWCRDCVDEEGDDVLELHWNEDWDEEPMVDTDEGWILYPTTPTWESLDASVAWATASHWQDVGDWEFELGTVHFGEDGLDFRVRTPVAETGFALSYPWTDELESAWTPGEMEH